MSEEMQSGTSRRHALLVVAGAVTLAAAGGIAYLGGLFGPTYPKTPYDDLLALLPDRTRAMAIGKVVLAKNPDFDANAVAKDLRARIADKPLGDVLAADIAAGKTVEIEGWVIPETLAQLCALAAA